MLNIAHRDLVTIFSKSIVNDEGVLAYVRDISADGVFDMVSAERTYIKEYMNYEDLPTSPKIPYYVNNDSEYCFSVIRKQVRRFKQGVCSDNTSLYKVLENGSTYRIGLEDHIKKLLKKREYPSKQEAISELVRGKKLSLAIDEQICLTNDLSIFFKDIVIGKWSLEGNLDLFPSYQHVVRYNKCLQ